MASTVDVATEQCKKIHGTLKNWAAVDWYTIFKPLENMGYKWDPFDLRMRQIGPMSMHISTPWCHARSLVYKHCTLDHQIIFGNWGIIPPRCQECWKVVVSPRSFHETILLEKLQIQMDVPSKCGMELREYTPKHWGGYFYTCSLDEGRQRYKEVKDAVSDAIDPALGESLILKRGCTEMEFLGGPSPYWHTTPEQEDFLKIIDAKVDAQNGQGDQLRMVKSNVRMQWAFWAHANGDMSYLDYNDGKNLFPDYVKYHEGDIEDIKHDLALARAEAKGIKPATAEKFLILCDEFARDHNMKMSDLHYALGNNYENPLAIELIKTTVKEDMSDFVKSDADETT